MAQSYHVESHPELSPPAFSRSPIADRTALAICLGAILYFVVGYVSPGRPKPLYPVPLQPIDSGNVLASGSGFQPDALPGLSKPPYVRGKLDFYGSFLGGGDTLGGITTTRFKAVPDFYIFVSGFPNRAGNRLIVEVTGARGRVTNVPVAPFEDMAGVWLLKRISLQSVEGAQSFRILAKDANKGPEGWLGFSQPFQDSKSSGQFGLLPLKQFSFVLLAAAACLVTLLSPGLILRQLRFAQTGRLFSLIFVLLPGLLGFALLGIAAWIGPASISPGRISRVGYLLVAILATYRLYRYPLSTFTTNYERRLFLVVLVVAGVCIGKSIYSLGPIGELYHDEISRTLEVGGRSDSRTPYFVIQLIATRQKPSSPFAGELYETWTFSDRGPIVPLALAPVVLSGPIYIPAHKPQEVWTVFDPEGFEIYRVGMIVCASCMLLMVWGLSRVFIPEPWAYFASLIAATSPFFLHDTYFTWPKLEAAGFVLLSGYLALRSRYLAAGLALGAGYLCHPSALLSLPAILALILLTDGVPSPLANSLWKRLPSITRRAILIFVGLGLWLWLWRMVNIGKNTQGQFLYFFKAAGYLPPTIFYWLRFRANSIVNTLVPLNVFLFFSDDGNMNAVEGPSPPIVRFFLQPWFSLPFGLGVFTFACFLRCFYLGWRRARSWFLLLLVVPFLIFDIYMGADESGLLKDGMHAWFLSVIIFSVVMWRKYGSHSQRFWRICSFALFSRVAEILAMMLIPTFWTQKAVIRSSFAFTDLVALAMMVPGAFWLCLTVFRQSEQLRLASAEH